MGNFLDNNPIGNLVGAGVGAIDSIFGISQRRQENAQKRLMEQQQKYWNQQNEILYNQQVEQWNRENIYNDPTNAIRRLLDGASANGLSKAQVLNGAGSQVQSQGASGVTAPGSVSTPSTSGAPIYSMGQGVMNSMRQIAEIDLLESEAERNRSSVGLQDAQKGYYKELTVTTANLGNLHLAQEATEKQKAESLRLQNIGQKINNRTLAQKNQAELIKLSKEIESIIEQAGLTKANREYREKELGVFDQRYNREMLQAAAEYKLTLAKAYAERMMGEDSAESAKYRNITNKELEQRYKETLRNMKYENMVFMHESASRRTASPWSLVGVIGSELADLAIDIFGK